MNRKQKNSIGTNVLHLFISTTLSRALNAFTLIILANYLDSYRYGMFSVALAFAMVMGYFTDAGLSNTVLREGSRQDADLPAIVSSYIKLRLLLLILTFAGAFLIIHSLYDNEELIQIMYCLMIPMVLGLAMQSVGITYFQLNEQMQYLGAIRIWSSVFLIVTIGIGMRLSLHPYMISFLFGFSYFLAGLYGLYMVHKSIGIALKQHFQKGLLDNIWSFIISGLLIMLLPQLGPLVLENTITLNQVGIFAVAYRIPSALYQIPGIIGGAFYPVLFKHYSANERKEHLNLSIFQVKIMGLIGILITIPFYHMSGLVIRLLFGEKWILAAEPLQILSILLVLQGIGIALGDNLTTQNLQTRRTVVQLAAVIAGGILYYILSIQYSVIGASYAALSMEVLALLGFWLVNPDRWIIAKKALFPYIAFFSISLFAVHYFLGAFPLSATIISSFSLFLILLDSDMRQRAMQYTKKTKRKAERTKEQSSQCIGEYK